MKKIIIYSPKRQSCPLNLLVWNMEFIIVHVFYFDKVHNVREKKGKEQRHRHDCKFKNLCKWE